MKNIKKLCGLSKKLPRHGYGANYVLWADGQIDYAHSASDCVARCDGTPRLIRLDRPTPMTEIASRVAEAEAYYATLDAEAKRFA